MATLKTTFQDIETDSEVCVAVFLIIGHLGDNFEISINRLQLRISWTRKCN